MTPLSCANVRELLDSYVAGELGVESPHQIHEHLRHCAACRGALRGIRRRRAALRTLYRDERAPDALHRRLAELTRVDRQHVPKRRMGRALGWLGAGVGVAATIVWSIWTQTPVSAAALLRESAERSATADATAHPDRLLSRSVMVQEQVAPGRFELRRRVDVVRDAARRLSVRRAFDDGGRLVAGEWLADDGSAVVYRPGRTAHAGRREAAALLAVDELWRLDPSARDFRAALFSEADVSVVTLDDRYVITSRRLAGGVTPLTAEIELSAHDLHPLALTIDIVDGRQVRRFRLSERAQLTRNRQDVSASLFEPDTGLIATPRPASASIVTTAHRTVAPARELEALVRLRRSGADAVERIELVATGGHLIARGQAPTTARRDEIRAALTRGGVLRDLTIAIDVAATASDIQPGDALETGTRHARLLLDTVRRFPSARRRPLTIDQLSQWHSLIRDHARAIRQSLRLVEPVVSTCGPVAIDAPVDVAVTDASAFIPAGARLLDLVSAIEDRVQLPRTAADPCAGDLAQLVGRATHLADEFTRPWPLEP